MAKENIFFYLGMSFWHFVIGSPREALISGIGPACSRKYVNIYLIYCVKVGYRKVPFYSTFPERPITLGMLGKHRFPSKKTYFSSERNCVFFRMKRKSLPNISGIPYFIPNVSDWVDSLTFRLSRPKKPTRSHISIINVRSKDIYMRTHLLSVIPSYICLFPHYADWGVVRERTYFQKAFTWTSCLLCSKLRNFRTV